MKRNSLWAGIIGGLIIFFSLIEGANTIGNPSNIFLVNVANGIADILWIFAGIFLLVAFLKMKQAEDAGHTSATLVPNSPEDKEFLRKKRNWIFGFFLYFVLIGFSEILTLNDYRAGFVPINVATWLYIVFGAIFLYIIVELFRNKKYILSVLFYTVILFAIGEGVISVWRDHWPGLVWGILFAFYFIYAIKAPLNRKQYRIAQLIILPSILILAIGLNIINDAKINQLWKEETTQEEQYLNANNDLNSKYSQLSQEIPTSADIQNEESLVKNTEEKIADVTSTISELQEEYQMQTPSILKERNLERLNDLLAIFNIDREQLYKAEDLVAYEETVDFNSVSETQKTTMVSLMAKMTDFNSQIHDAQLKFSTD